MAIYLDKAKGRWRFDYQATVSLATGEKQRVRATRLLPAGWSKSQAREYEVAEIARIVGEASSGRKPEPTIHECVLAYLRAREGTRGHKSATEHLMAISSYYLGKPLSELVEVAERIVSEKMRAEDEPRGKRDPRTKQYAKWSRGTVHNRLTYLHAACYEAYEKRRVETDYTRGMEIPSADNERQVYADRRQILGIAKACDRQDARALVLIGFYTGLRLGEMQKCQIVDGHIYVPPKASKNSKPRLLPAHPRIRHWALKYLPLKAPRITLQRAVERARKRTDSWDINIHALRHSAASAMVNNGVDLYAVGKVLGHLDLRSSRRYAHLDTETIGAAIGKIGAKKV